MKSCSKCKEVKVDTDFNKNQRLCRSCTTAHSKANAATLRATTAKFRKNNLGYLQTWREANRAKTNAYRAAWAKANKGKVNARNAKYRAAKRNTRVDDDPRIEALYEIATWLRARGDDVHVDHITPLARGGTHTYENLQILTAFENMSKGART